MIQSRSEVEAIARNVSDASGTSIDGVDDSLSESLDRFDLDGDGWLTVTELLTFARLRADELQKDMESSALLDRKAQEDNNVENARTQEEELKDLRHEEEQQQDEYEEDFVEDEDGEDSDKRDLMSGMERGPTESHIREGMATISATTSTTTSISTPTKAGKPFQTRGPSVNTKSKDKNPKKKLGHVGPYSQTRINSERKFQKEVRMKRFEETFRKKYPGHHQ